MTKRKESTQQLVSVKYSKSFKSLRYKTCLKGKWTKICLYTFIRYRIMWYECVNLIKLWCSYDSMDKHKYDTDSKSILWEKYSYCIWRRWFYRNDFPQQRNCSTKACQRQFQHSARGSFISSSHLVLKRKAAKTRTKILPRGRIGLEIFKRAWKCQYKFQKLTWNKTYY